MPKRATPHELVLTPRDPAVPAYRWLYEALRAGILEGRLRPGVRLPSTRDLGAQYGLARGTIIVAFEQLRSEGYTRGSVGSGTYVSSTLPDDLLRVAPQGDGGPAASRRPRRRFSVQGRRVTAFPVLESRPSRAFRANLPALDLFPTDALGEGRGAAPAAGLGQAPPRLRADGLSAPAGGGRRLPERARAG